MNNKIIAGIIAVIAVMVLGLGMLWSAQKPAANINQSEKISGEEKPAKLDEKIYVALEGESKIAVIKDNKLYKQIDLTKTDGDKTIIFSAHNVQVAPDGKSVWATAMVKEVKEKKDMGFRIIPQALADEMDEPMKEKEPDEVVVIDPKTDAVIKRIPLYIAAHVAHVIVSMDGNYAYATAQKEGIIYKINAKTFAVEKKIEAPMGSEPHGLRMTPDGKSVYIAYLKGKAVGILDAKIDTLSDLKTDGAAVQTGVLPNGKTAAASLYDTKKIAIIDIASGNLSYINLPSESKGPVQIYPTPDSKYLYVADQGYYFDQPSSDKVYKIDMDSQKIVKTIEGGVAPHGIVVAKSGLYAYVTNLLGNDVSVIDLTNDQEIARIPVGKTPNGISVWSEKGGTP